MPTERRVWQRAEALDRLGGDADLLRELCQIFLEESPKFLQKLRQALVDGDPEAVLQAAHNLKGELSYLGAGSASQAARQLEIMGHEKDLSRGTETLDLLERELANLHSAMKDSAGMLR